MKSQYVDARLWPLKGHQRSSGTIVPSPVSLHMSYIWPKREMNPVQQGQQAPFVVPEPIGRVPGPGMGNGSNGNHGDERDVFAKSEKCLSAPPKLSHQEWKNREDEILGWSSYVQELSSWANLESPEFGREIDQSSRWMTPISWSVLSSHQQIRAVRLFSVIKTACIDHGRIALWIQGFSEGLDIVPSDSDSFGSSTAYNSNGFELLRQLTREFSLRSRSEALSLRASLMGKVYQPSQLALRSSAQVSDVIRQVEISCARFQRLVSTLDPRDVPGLSISHSDQLLLLVRSLPVEVKQYCLMHASGESYSAYRSAARKFETQNRLFMELQGNRRLFGLQEEQPSGSKEQQFGQGDDDDCWEDLDGDLRATFPGDKSGKGAKCTRCDKKGHETSKCTVSCFKCGSQGHISLNCKQKRKDDDSVRSSKSNDSSMWKKGSAKGKGSKGSPSPKGKGKGGKSKTGKLFCVWDEETDQWWYSSVDEEETEAGDTVVIEEEHEVMMLTACVSCDVNQMNEPNTRDNHRSIPEFFDMSAGDNAVESHLGGSPCETSGMAEPACVGELWRAMCRVRPTLRRHVSGTRFTGSLMTSLKRVGACVFQRHE